MGPPQPHHTASTGAEGALGRSQLCRARAVAHRDTKSKLCIIWSRRSSSPTVSPIAAFPAVTAASTSAPLAFHQDDTHYILVSTSPVIAAPITLTRAIPVYASVSPLIISTSSVVSTLLTGASGSPSAFSPSALSVVVLSTSHHCSPSCNHPHCLSTASL
ncbi:hypothetical protein F5148DRAFT_1224070, partial [Russula earlei]